MIVIIFIIILIIAAIASAFLIPNELLSNKSDADVKVNRRTNF